MPTDTSVKIITIAFWRKGGVGKTTTAINLAIELASKKNKVALIDLDSSKRATDFGEKRVKQDVKFFTLESGEELIDKISKLIDFDYIVIDTAGYETDLIKEASLLSDVTIVPVSDSDSEEEPMEEFIGNLKIYTAPNENHTIKILTTRVKHLPNVSYQLRDRLQEKYKEMVFQTAVASLKVYSRMGSTGLSAKELSKELNINPRAIEDTEELTEEIIKELEKRWTIN